MPLSILLVTGQSGSGKSTAVRALEDCGWFCVDNMPVALVDELVRVLRDDEAVERLALVMDVRERKFIQEGPDLVARLRQGGTPVRVLYLDAKEDSLLRRYSETRRTHPLDDGCGLRAAIANERETLSPLRELADETIDSSIMSPHDLRARIITQLGATAGHEGLSVAILSFGFKHGVPLEADIVLDVRFLPNPYFDPALRDRTGLDDSVSRYALGGKEGEEFLDRATSFLAFLIPQYRREGKRYLTVAIGCTGGRHRSVAAARELARRLSGSVAVDVRHRDIQEGART
jgi:UPF0042 nucleotide-binding protein